MGSDSHKTGRPTLDPVTPTAEPAATPPLSEIVAESQQRLADTPQIGVQKRGRGRHPKGCACGKCSQSQPHSVSGVPGAANSPSQGAIPAGTPGAVALPSMAPIFAEGIKLPFAIKAANSGFEGWKLSDAEASVLGGQIDEVVRIYMPAMDPKHAVLATLGVSLMMITGSRMMGEADYKRKVLASKPAAGPAPSANGSTPPPTSSPKQNTPTPGDVSTMSLTDALSGFH